MRSSSVFSFVKPTRTTLAATILAILLTTAAAAAPATPRTHGESHDSIRHQTAIERVIQIVKRFLGVSSQSEISIPVPTKS